MMLHEYAIYSILRYTSIVLYEISMMALSVLLEYYKISMFANATV